MPVEPVAHTDAQTPRADGGMPPFSLATYRVLIPSVLGLAFATAAVSTVVQAAHWSTGISADGGATMIVSCLVMVALFVSTLFVKRYSKRFVSISTFLAVHVAGVCSLGLAVARFAVADVPQLAVLALGVGVTVGSTWLQFYWLRKLRGVSAQAAVIVVFCALGLSELLTFALSLAGPASALGAFAAVVLCFAQFAAIRVSRAADVPSDHFPGVSQSYFGTDPEHFSNTSFLVVAAMGIWLISIPLGMGRGFPQGEAVGMSFVPRFLVLVFTLVVSALWVRYGLRSRMSAITTSIWVAMEFLIALGAVFFAIWPATVSMGASFVMTAALVLNAFAWYLTIAFISFGWRDPFYYTSAAWIAVNLLTVAGMKVDLLITQVFPSNTPVIISIMSFFTLLGAQLVFTRLLSSPSQQREERERAEAAADAARAADAQQAAAAGDTAASEQPPAPLTLDAIRRVPLMGVLAIAEPKDVPMVSTTPDSRIASAVIAMGQRFGLTGREVEVITLYALGHTQQRVSEELQLSTSTVHTHIKHVYEKTDLHSRQEILDYINEYES